jgi:DNA-binding transcriptional LysR family regulator
MNTEFFLEFETLSKLESYSEAAEQLLISESALSRHIKALEDELGVRLFDRTSRKVKLNECGKIFLPYARQFISMQHQYSHDLARGKHSKDTVFICSYYYIDDLLFFFHNFDTNTSISSVNFFNNATDQWPKLLQQNTCELVFAINPVDKSDEFMMIPFETDYYVAVFPKLHPFSGRKSLTLSEMARENFVSFKDDSYSDRRLKDLCLKAGFEPNIIFNLDTGSNIADFIKEGIGVSILLRKALSKMNAHDVTLVDLEPEVSIQVNICYSKTVALSEGAQRFLRFISERWPELKAKKRQSP